MRLYQDDFNNAFQYINESGWVYSYPL